MRQAAESGILTDANKIRDGVYPIDKPETKIISGKKQDMVYVFKDNKEHIRNLAVKNYLSAVEKFGLDEVVMLVPRKKNCINSTLELNNIIQNKLIPQNVPYIKYGDKTYKQGAKVVQRVNDYEKNVFNGEIGYIKKIWTEKQDNVTQTFFDVEFPMFNKKVTYEQKDIEQLDLAYALTIHLSQGSEYKAVIVVVDNSHYILLDSCLLYTAITRAKEKCILFSEIKAFKSCINNNKNINRQTWLKIIKQKLDKN